MKHLKLDRQPEPVKSFIRSLDVGVNGTILELSGKRLLKVLPVTEEEPVDVTKLKASILRRRQRSRRLNAEWQGVDHPVGK